MSGFIKIMLVVVTFAFCVSLSEAADSRKPDLTKRQTQVGDKRAPMKMHEMKMNDQLTDKRFPIKEWHGEFSPLGRRRASINMSETREKTVVRPQVIEIKKQERKMAPMNGRKAFVRNFDKVKEKELSAKYRDAQVVHVKQASVPAPSKKQQKDLTMRDINRFTFQRNHSDAHGLKVDKAGSGEKE